MPFDDIQAAYGKPMAVGECPLWHHGENNLYWVDINSFTVHRLTPASGEHREWRLDSEPTALAIDARGGLIVAQRSGVAHLDTSTGALTPIVTAIRVTSDTSAYKSSGVAATEIESDIVSSVTSPVCQGAKLERVLLRR